MSYREWLPLIVPRWLQGPISGAMLGELGGSLDVLRERLVQGVKARLPAYAPTDALDTIGQDRRLYRGPGEVDSAYVERLRAAWNTWELAGTHGELLRQLAVAGFTGMYIIQRNGRRASLDGSGNLVLTDGTAWTATSNGPEFWNQFAIVFPADVPTLTIDSAAAELLNRIVREWKPGEAFFAGTWILLGGVWWGWPVTVTWGGGGRTWGGTHRYIAPA